MRQNIDEDIDNTERIINSAMEMQEFIEERRELEPAPGRVRQQWVKDMNNMIETYNSTYGKTYNRVK